MRAKITVVGAGNVGTDVVHWVAVKELGDIVWVNRTPEKAMGKALDLMEAAPIVGFDANIIGTDDYRKTRGSDVVVITAGSPRKPGMQRAELLQNNAAVVTDIMKKCYKHSPKAFYIIVTNPLDAMVHACINATKVKRNKIAGMAGVLDTTRYESFIARVAKVSFEDVSGIVLGSHGPNMVPLERFTTISGIPVTEFLTKKQLADVKKHTIKAGAQIIKLLKANASFSVGAAASEMIESYLHDKKRVLPCSVLLKGEYGFKDVCIGVPIIIGKKGVERIIQLKLNAAEKKALSAAAKHSKELSKKLR